MDADRQHPAAAAAGRDELRRIGPYEVVARAHRSHLSDVYRCRESALRRDVAVKLLRVGATDRRAAVARLRQEALVRATVDHGSVLPLFRSGRSPAGPYLAGPWLTGGTLLERQPALRFDAIATLARELGSALDALHEAGWVHGDLNGRNVLFAGDGRAVLIDFGSVRPVGSRWPRSRGGRPSAGLGVTPHTTPPEVWRGEPVGGRSDLYALGALLYRCLTGRYPFEGEDPWTVAELHCGAPVPSLAPAHSDADERLEAVLQRALAKDPNARFASGADLAAALRDALDADAGVVRGEDAAAIEEMPGEAALRSAAAQIERFAATLDAREQAALRAMLAQREEEQGRATAELASLTTNLFGPGAALLALEASGAAQTLADGQSTPHEIADACGAPAPAVARLLEVLVAAGLAGQSGGRYSLPPPLAVAYAQGQRWSRPARPVRQAAELWSRLSDWARARRPQLSMDRPDGGGYAPVVETLAGLFVEPAHDLARHLRDSGRWRQGAAILDVGAGAGVWGIAAAAADAESSLTVLDRPAVVEVARARAQAAGIVDRFAALAGDWRTVDVPTAAFDLVLVANLCHLEPEAEVRALLRRLRPALRGGGRLIVIDTIPEDRGTAPLSVLLGGLRLALRTPAGDVHDLVSYRRALEEAELTLEERLPLLGTEPLAALITCARSEA